MICLPNNCLCLSHFDVSLSANTRSASSLFPFSLPPMQGRPSSSRPSTSARPTTAFDRDQFHHIQHHIQQQQPHEIEEESEEESDDEDVFAFLPPTTADQEQQSTSHSPFAFSPVPYPEPTFDPWGRQHPITPSPAPPLPPGIRGISSQTHPNPLPNSKPPISPPSPSTDSHPSTGMSGPDFYRLKRLGTAALSKLGVVDNAKEMKEKSDRNGIDITNIGEKKAETYPSDDSNLERDTSLHRLSPTIPPWKGVTDGVVSVLRERGTKNPNAMPYKMYSQQASSYYGRDVRTGTASASGASMYIPLLSSFPLTKPLSQPLKMPDSQPLNPRLSNTLPDLRIHIHILTSSHHLNLNTGNGNTMREPEYWECHKLLAL